MPNVLPLPALSDLPVLYVLGFALVHSLWQGALVGALLWAALKLLSPASARLRYGASCLALAALLAVPAATGVGLWYGLTTPVAVTGEAAPRLTSVPADVQATPTRPDVRPAEEEARVGLTSALWPYLPYVGVAWGACAFLLLLRLLGGWGYARLLAKRGVRPTSEAWQARLDRLARRMDVRRLVRLRVTEGDLGPCVVGWRRPTVLVPARVLAALPAEQVEAILAHELAHVRRRDYLVNGWQSVAEALLFYHPALWWTSGQVRAEREHCCDDRGAALCESPTLYAGALVALETSRRTSAPFALAATDGPLLSRIRRLVAPAPKRRSPAAKAALASVLVLAAGALVAACADVLTDGPPEGVEGTSVQTAEGVQYREWRPYDFSVGDSLKFKLHGNYGGVRIADSTWSKPFARVRIELSGFAATEAEAEQVVRAVQLSRQGEGELKIEGPKGDSTRHWTVRLTTFKPASSEPPPAETRAPALESYRDRRTVHLPADGSVKVHGGSIHVVKEDEDWFKPGELASITVEGFAETAAEARQIARDVRIAQDGEGLRIDGPENTDVRRWRLRFASSGRVD